MSRLRVGVIGAGRMGTHHVRAYSILRDIELVGVADPDPGALERFARLFRVPGVADFHDLLPRVDAVSVTVPTSLHYEIAHECLTAGKHALVEKPITRDVRQAEELAAIAEGRRLVLQVGHIERFNPAIQELRRLLADETVLAISTRRCSPPTPHMQDVDVVYDLLIHDIDIALAISGSSPRTVRAMGSAVKHHQADLVLVHMEMENGVLADLVASKITQQRIRTLDVTTERTYVTLDYLHADLSVYKEATVVATELGPIAHTQGTLLVKPVVRPVEPLLAEIQHFVSAIAGAPMILQPADAIAALRIADRIEEQIVRQPASA